MSLEFKCPVANTAAMNRLYRSFPKRCFATYNGKPRETPAHIKQCNELLKISRNRVASSLLCGTRHPHPRIIFHGFHKISFTSLAKDPFLTTGLQKPDFSQLDKEKEILRSEASFMTRSFYRTCLRSIRIIRPGNEYDEEEFSKREEEQLKPGSGSYGLPVDRENELESRFDYYMEWTGELFTQESDCLDDWMIESIDRYVHFLSSGEDKRKWILADYKFEDKWGDKFDYDRLSRFEARAKEMVKNKYKIHGWHIKSVDEIAKNNDDSLLDSDSDSDLDSDDENDNAR